MNNYFKSKIAREDIVHTYSGVRPLLEEKNASAQELTRDYKVELKGERGKPVLLNIFGGKITTYRKLAEHAVDKLVTCFPKAKKAWTKEVPLPGGAFENQVSLVAQLTAEFPWLDKTIAERYARQYGLLSYKFLKGKCSVDAMGEHFGAGMYQAEVDYLIEREWACSLEDVIWRRTKHGLRLNQAQQDALSSYIITKVSGPVATEEQVEAALASA